MFTLHDSTYCYENRKNLDTGVLILHRLTLKLETKARKTNQCSKQTCLQIIVLLNMRTNVNKNGKQVNKNTTTNTKIINVYNYDYML